MVLFLHLAWYICMVYTTHQKRPISKWLINDNLLFLECRLMPLNITINWCLNTKAHQWCFKLSLTSDFSLSCLIISMSCVLENYFRNPWIDRLMTSKKWSRWLLKLVRAFFSYQCDINLWYRFAIIPLMKSSQREEERFLCLIRVYRTWLYCF